ncbi:MAG: glycosyltransferase family 4 protein [Candidatus Omnitrophota bacterium]|jgi:glycosyltransferase involved in cell wall biosynthesis
MKVFVLGIRGFPGVQGGIEKHCEELYPRLVKLGCEVVVCTRLPYIKSYQRIKQWQGVSYKHIWAPKKKNFEAIVHTFLGIIIARVNSIKILHIHAVGPAILIPLARLLGMKVIFTHHGSDYQRNKWSKFAKVALRLGEFLGLKFADRVIAISRTNKKFLEEKYGRKDIAYIPNGVTLPQIEPGDEILKKYRLEPNRYVFTACRFVPEKGLHDLVEAYKRINNPELKLVIAGDADHETKYSRKLKKDAQDAGVVLTGFLSGKPLSELFSNAGLFVLPSYHEGMPIVLLEALSYGLPLLVSDIPPNREISLPEFRYFKAGDINDLSRKIQELIKKGVSQAEKEAYREILDKDYNWDRIAEATYNLFRAV